MTKIFYMEIYKLLLKINISLRKNMKNWLINRHLDKKQILKTNFNQKLKTNRRKIKRINIKVHIKKQNMTIKKILRK